MEKSFSLEKSETLLVEKIKKILDLASIYDYDCEEATDSVLLKIKTPPEHTEERSKQMQKFGSLEPTQFIKDKIIPFKKLLLQENLKFDFVATSNSEYIEVVISK